ncbi:MAG: hypothetical protein KBF93_08075 [Leptospiraceae bacterium]|nr:hypothetical protein [Leptospiraceae bacterium]
MNGEIETYRNVFLEEDTNNNALRDHRSWQSIIPQGSTIADIHLQINKDILFKKGKEFFLALNDFFIAETGLKLFEKNSERLFPSGEEWKRLGNLEFIKRVGKENCNDLFKVSLTEDKIIFYLEPNISDKEFLAVSFQISNFGLFHSYGMKTVKRSKLETVSIEFPIQSNKYCKGYYQIFESHEGQLYSLIVEDNITLIKQINFTINPQVGLPDLLSPESTWNKFTAELKNKEETKKELLKVNRSSSGIESKVFSEKNDYFYKFSEYENLINKQRSNKPKSFSKFFSGDARGKLELAQFLKNITEDLKEKHFNIDRIILADPFANEEAIRCFVIQQKFPVELILNSEQRRDKTEEDPNGFSGNTLKQEITKVCMEYSHKFSENTKILDINKINNSSDRSFHDRYIIIEGKYNDEVAYKGYLLSSSLTSYFAGTPASLSELDSETSHKIFQYLENLKAGYSTFERKRNNIKDLICEEIWPALYLKNKTDTENEISKANNKLLQEGIKVLIENKIISPIELEEATSNDENEFRFKFNKEMQCNFYSLINYFKDKEVELNYRFFAFLNILSGHAYCRKENIYKTFLSDEFIKHRYVEYISDWKNYTSPVGIKNEFISYEQLPLLKQSFRIFNGLPHNWISVLAQQFDCIAPHFDSITQLYEIYLEYEPEFAVIILEDQFGKSDFLNKVNSITKENEIHGMEKSARLGQVVLVNLFHEIQIENIPKFLQALVGSRNSWIKQMGLTGIFLYRTEYNRSNQYLLENSNLLVDSISLDERISLAYAIYTALLYKKTKERTFSNEANLNANKLEFYKSFENIAEKDIFQKFIRYLLYHHNRVDLIVQIIKDAKSFFSEDLIQKIYEELLYRIIIIKLKEKDSDYRKDFSDGFNIYKMEAISIFNLLNDKTSLKKRAKQILEEFRKIALRKLNEPFIIRKDLQSVWKLTEGIAWCIYFMELLSFTKDEINAFDKIVIPYIQKPGRAYTDWPDFKSLTAISQ